MELTVSPKFVFSQSVRDTKSDAALKAWVLDDLRTFDARKILAKAAKGEIPHKK